MARCQGHIENAIELLTTGQMPQVANINRQPQQQPMGPAQNVQGGAGGGVPSFGGGTTDDELARALEASRMSASQENQYR